MKRAAGQFTLSLFPFLSVLMCAIGVLIVLICGNTLTALESTRQTFVVTVRDVQARRWGREFEMVPTYVVCDRNGLTVHSGPDAVETVSAATLRGPNADAELDRLAMQMERLERQRWPMLFVKPSGLDYMQKLYDRLSDRNVPVGKWAFGEESIIECVAAE